MRPVAARSICQDLWTPDPGRPQARVGASTATSLWPAAARRGRAVVEVAAGYGPAPTSWTSGRPSGEQIYRQLGSGFVVRDARWLGPDHLRGNVLVGPAWSSVPGRASSRCAGRLTPTGGRARVRGRSSMRLELWSPPERTIAPFPSWDGPSWSRHCRECPGAREGVACVTGEPNGVRRQRAPRPALFRILASGGFRDSLLNPRLALSKVFCNCSGPLTAPSTTCGLGARTVGNSG